VFDFERMEHIMEKYKNTRLSPEERAADLLSLMTLDEKFNEVASSGLIVDIASRLDEGEEFPLGINMAIADVKPCRDAIRKIQDYNLQKTRLKIPALIVSESLHGLMTPGATVFPQSIGLGCAFDDELIEDMANVIGREAYASGIRQVLAPDLDLAREPRWGRTEETYGEDPYLTSRYARAYVRGVQNHKVATTVKHFLAHGSPESGVNLAPVHVGMREIRELMLEPFAAAIEEGALSLMPPYSEIDGEAVHTSKYYLTEFLRGELQFKGYVISDFGAIELLTYFQNVAHDKSEAGYMALSAGVDVEAALPYCYDENVKIRIPAEVLDEAVRRILTVKFALGLFENPYPDEEYTELRNAESLALTKKAALEVPVLLENDGVLPLPKDFGKIALIGPCVDEIQLGDYTAFGSYEYAVGLKDVLLDRFGSERVLVEKGVSVAFHIDNGLERAKNAMEASGVVLLVLGDNSTSFGGIGWGEDSGKESVITCGEGFDVSSLSLPPVQLELFETACRSGKPIVLILQSGRPYAIGDLAKRSNAVIASWYLGELGGEALCDILFGDACPSGKLCISFPQSEGHIPCYYNYKVSAHGIYKVPGTPESPGRDYVFSSPDPLYPFGYGLSYTTFAYGEPEVKVDSENAQVELSFSLTNTGTVAGCETALVFVKQHICPITPFVKRLRAFRRVDLEPGETKMVSFVLGKDDFSFINHRMEKDVGRGVFSIFVGDKTVEFTL